MEAAEEVSTSSLGDDRMDGEVQDRWCHDRITNILEYWVELIVIACER